MLDQLIVYALSVYWLFHLFCRSDLLAKPRAWVMSKVGVKLSYPCSCAFCFTAWFAIGTTIALWLFTGILMVSFTHLLAAPVFNLVLDLVVKALVRAGQPPVVLSPALEPTITTSHSGGGVTWVQNTASYNGPINIPSVWIPSDSTYFSYNLPDPVPSHVGRRIRINHRSGLPCADREGTIQRHFVNNDDCSNWFRKVRYTVLLDGDSYTIDISPEDCVFIDSAPPAAPSASTPSP